MTPSATTAAKKNVVVSKNEKLIQQMPGDKPSNGPFFKNTTKNRKTHDRNTNNHLRRYL